MSIILDSSEPDLTNDQSISQIIDFPEYSWNANLHLQEFLCQYVRLHYTECARKVKEHETDVGTRFVQMRYMLCRTCKTASSTPRSLLYANCKGSRKSARRFCSYDSTTLSNTFMMADVRATGRKSFTTFTVVFFGTGIIQEVLHKAGIEH